MTRKNKYHNTTQKRLKPEAVGLILGLLFGYLEYFLDLRPRLAAAGLYELGFVDCIVFILSILLLIGIVKKVLKD